MSLKKFLTKEAIILFIVGLILTPIVSELVKRYFSEDDQIELEYEVSFKTNLSKNELIKTIQKNF